MKSQRYRILLGFVFFVTVLGIGYAIISTIRSEGQQTRESMEELATGTGVNEIAKGGVSAMETLNKTAEAVLGGDGQEDDSSLSGKAQSARKSDGDNDLPTASAGDLISGLFQVGRDTAKTLDNTIQDALELDADTRQRIGFEIHQRIIVENGVLNDPQLERSISKIAQPILEQSGLKTNTIKFTVLDSPAINAFAHIGGYVYLNKGLIDIHDDDELQFVVGHEVGHIVLGHCSKKITYAVRAAEVGGDLGGSLAEIAYHAISIGYSQDDEFEADRFSYDRLSKKSAAIGSLKKIANALGETTSAENSESPLDVAFEELDLHFRSHPPTNARIQSLQRSGKESN
jgi:predicted Zn-dependent protease